MCLITTAPKGVLKTTDALVSFVENGMKSNTDGSGFAAKKKGVIILEKGFRTPKDLLAAIAKHKLTKSDELIIHHRIGTSGKPNDINMHPFVVSDNEELLRSTSGTFNLPVMAHNGVFSSYTDRTSDYNDTYHFIEKFMSTPEVLALMKRDVNKFKEVFKSTLGWAKLAFLLPDQDLTLIGDFTEDSGYFHSNSGYKTYTYDYGGSSRSSRNWNYGYGDDYDDDGYPSRASVVNTVRNHTANLNKNLTPAIPMLFSEVVKKNICFLPGDIKITELNYHHFILVPVADYNGRVVVDRGYTIENYDTEAMVNPIIPVNGEKVLEWLNIDKLIGYCNIYVKNEYENFYSGLRKLITLTNRAPSRSMIKKIRKALGKGARVSLNFKDYGYIRWMDLNHFYNTYKEQYEGTVTRDDDESSEINVAEGVGVSQLEL